MMKKYITQTEWNQWIHAAVAKLAPTEMYEADPAAVEFAASNTPEELRPVIWKTAARSFVECARRGDGTTTLSRSSAIQKGQR
jgi:hypothetical protein